MITRRTIVLCVCAFALALVPLARAGVNDGLIAYWPLDEGKGDKWNDAVGKHNATVEEEGKGGWTDDAQFGSAYRFETTLVKVPNTDDINEMPDGFTLAHWIKPEAGGAIMDKSGTDATRIQWYILGDLRHHWGLGGNFGFSDGNPVPKFGEWYHFAWTHVKGETFVYRDGEVVGEGANLGDYPITDEPMYFGNRLPKENRQEWFKGILDDIGYWTRPLEEDEVVEVFKRGLAGLLAVSPQGKLATSWATMKTR